MRIYVAGKYTAKTKKERNKNIKEAEETGKKLLKLGHEPYVPHCATAKWEEKTEDYWRFVELHLTFIKHWAEAILKISNSKGADIEESYAKSKGIPIYYTTEEIP